MKEEKKYIIENLTKDSVTIHTIYYILFNGQELQARDLHTCTYINNEQQRSLLISDIPDPYLSSILIMWGQMPTLDLEKYKAYESVDKL